MGNEPTPQAPGAGDAEGAARPANEDGARPAGDVARKRRVWPWWSLGIACAVGLGIFMWAVGGQFNLNGPRPSGPAATPQQAVEKFMAAVEAHDKGLAESYCTPAFAPQVQHWLDRAGYLKYGSAEVLRGNRNQIALRVSFGSVTRFMDGRDPRGLNLGFLVFPQPLKRTFFVVVYDPAGSGWLVSGCDATP